MDLDKEAVDKAIALKDYKSLREHEQLWRSKEKKVAWVEFEEGDFTQFAPSYKFDAGTLVYDSSFKQRIPSWCDRVLYRGSNMELKEYTCRHDIIWSDHRPVHAKFEILW